MAAKILTLIVGILGTILALLFVDPEIKSLFDQFIQIIGLFMGVLGGLFVLGAITRRANGAGALIGALAGATVMFCFWTFTSVQAYLFTTVGIVSCVAVGYAASFAFARPTDLDGLTIHTIKAKQATSDEC